MKLHCPTCDVSFAVPEGKIPQGKGIKVICPKCRNPLDLPEALAGPGRMAGGEPSQSVGTAGRGADKPIEIHETDVDAALVDIVEDGVRTALLFIADTRVRDLLASTLGLMDFYVVAADSAPFALRKIRHNSYDIVVVDDVAEPGGKIVNPLLHHLQLLAMPVRRKFFLCLLSDNLHTMDQMTAYRLGVNLILNSSDLERSKIIFTRALKEHQGFYKLFQDELLRKGQL